MLRPFRPLLAITVAVSLLSFVSVIPTFAQNVSGSAAIAPPSNSDLDTLLAAKDWNRLGAALRPRDAASLGSILNWLHAKLDTGAGFLVAYSYMRNLWIAGNALKVNDPGKDMRVTAGMIALYTYEIIVIDGAKCEDRSAPDNRVFQLLSLNPATFSFLKSQTAELKAQIVDIALRFEKYTALLRSDDDLICRNGLDEFSAGFERGTQAEIPNTSGHYGRTMAVTPPPDWVPKFVPPATYVPLQNSARATMRENLLKLIE